MDALARRNRQYANTVALVVLVFFLLFVIWREDTYSIALLSEQALSYLGDHAHLLIPKLFLLLTMYVLFRVFSFLFVDVIVRQIHRFYQSSRDFSMVSRMLKLLLWTIFTIAALGLIFESNFGTVITSLGLVGFGITFALQKPILNFVGWLTISFKDIYKVGDRVKIGAVRGDVKEINMMTTVLESLLESADSRSGKILTLPNELVLTGDVENYTKETNYLVNELSITITYESDYKKAQKLLYDIALKVTKENHKMLKRQLREERESIEQTLLKLGEGLVRSSRAEKKEIEQQMRKLEEKEATLEHQEEELHEDFKPRVRVELRDSAIELICHFITPYDQIKANRTRINLLFLDAVVKDKDVEIAYPHMELVFNKSADVLKK